MNEFALIDSIVKRLEKAVGKEPRVQVGPGDDAAVVEVGSVIVFATCDALLEGTHFTWRLCGPEAVGWKAVAVNLSDIAAMGGCPLGLLVSFALPASFSAKKLLRVVDGVAEACREYGVMVWGGNLARTNGPFEVNIAAFGEAFGRRALLRSGARAGDGIFVSGPLGAAATGLRVLQKSPLFARRFPGLVAAWRKPRARVDIARALAESPAVHSAIDVSDGLLQDLSHMLRASGVGADVDVALLPLHPEASQACNILGMDPVELALNGGEDYELLVCADTAAEKGLVSLGFTRIGSVVARTRPLIRLLRAGKHYPMPRKKGFCHR